MKKLVVILITYCFVFAISGCASRSEVNEAISLQETYLSEVKKVAPTQFANDQAALSYLKQFCEIRLTAGLSRLDLTETIANNYCDTDLAKKLGVKVAPSPAVNFDEKDFTSKAKEIDPEIFQVLEDGSYIEPVALANQICSQSASELQTMKTNLDGFWETSFQKFAVETVCPEKLP